MSGNLNSIWRLSFVCMLFLTFSAFSADSAEKESHEFHFSHENILGTSLDLKIRSSSLESASKAESVILRSIERQSKIYSTYDKSSELSKLQALAAGKPIPASASLRALVERAQAWKIKTNGSFDTRVEAISRLWSQAEKAGQLPQQSEINAVLEKITSSRWLVDHRNGTIFRNGDAPVTFNAIATGTIIDFACREALASSPDVTGLIIDIGGDIKVAGNMEAMIGVGHPRGSAENAPPIARVRLKNAAITSSGDLYKGFEINGRRYSHIINPKTGRPVTLVTSATVIAPSAEDADVLATAFNVMEPEKSLALADSLEGVAALLFTSDGRLMVSSRWSSFTTGYGGLGNLLAMAMTNIALPQKSTGKAALLPLEVQFEINQPDESRRYRRPYVAVWIEDSEGFSVRTLALWLQAGGSRWHPDLRRWYRDDQARKLVDDTNLISTISKPTKAPGKYTVTWDGLDDGGQPVKAGTYTILIEAAREHGTYQLIRQELTLGDKPIEKKLAGNVEINAARIIYGGNAAK